MKYFEKIFLTVSILRKKLLKIFLLNNILGFCCVNRILFTDHVQIPLSEDKNKCCYVHELVFEFWMVKNTRVFYIFFYVGNALFKLCLYILIYCILILGTICL